MEAVSKKKVPTYINTRIIGEKIAVENIEMAEIVPKA